MKETCPIQWLYAPPRRLLLHATYAVVLSAAMLAVGAPRVAADSFSESIKDVVKCDSSGTCSVVRTGKFKVSSLAFEDEGLTADLFDESSVVIITVNGNEVYNGTLGDDPNYSAGDTKATLVRSHIDPGTGKTVIDAKIVISGSAAGVKITASGKISPFLAPLLADQYAGTTGLINDVTADNIATIQLGDFFDARGAVGIVGVAAVKQVTKNGQTFDLDSVKIKAVPPPL